MGSWATHATSKADRCKEVLKECNWVNGKIKSTLVGKRVTSTGMWTLQTVTNDIENCKAHILIFHLMNKQDGKWWVKSMDVGMGPYYYDCPASLVKEWKDLVKGEYTMCEKDWLNLWEKANALNERISVLITGQKVKYNGKEIEFRYWYNKTRSQFVGVSLSSGKTFRYKTDRIAEII